MTTERRRFTPLNMLAGSPTLESLVRREPTRRHFRQLSDGGTSPTEPAVLDDWQRQTTFKQALGTDVALPDYSTAWTRFLSTGRIGSPVYQILITGARTTAGGGNTYNPGDRWIRKMRPMRFTIYGANVTGQTQAFSSGLNIGIRNTSPPAAGHAKGAIVKYLTFRAAMVTPMVMQETKIAYVRVLKNGTDISGIVAVTGKFWDAWPASSYYRTCQFMADIPTITTVSADDMIDIDCWLYLSFTRAEAGIFAPDTLNVFQSPWHMECYASVAPGLSSPFAYNTRWTGSNCNARIGAADVFRVTWGSNAPGGTSPLTMEPQAGWTFQQVSRTSIMMTKTSAPSAGESVIFNWGREVPEIIANRLVTMPSGFAPRVRMVPVDSGHYNAAWPNIREGIWKPATTDFRAVSFLTADGSLYSPCYVDMPSTCTLERV